MLSVAYLSYVSTLRVFIISFFFVVVVVFCGYFKALQVLAISDDNYDGDE